MALKRDADHVFHELTRSICPECRRVIDAQVLLRDGRVYLRKRCPDHGPFEALVYGDADAYVRNARFNKPGTIPLAFHAEVRHGCPHDCGLCPEHQQHTCLGIIEVNSACVLGLADMVRRGRLQAGLDDLLAWMACVADAGAPGEYAGRLAAAGLEVTVSEDHDEALADLVRTVRLRLMGARVAALLAKVEPPGVDLSAVRELARVAERAIADGALGYALIVARKPWPSR